MPADTVERAVRIHWAWFVEGLIFAFGVTFISHQVWRVPSRLILPVALLLAAFRYRSLALVLELFFVDWLGKMIDGYPRARGACMICLGCVNLCPHNAMHMLCWTEYGQPYKPRWPELVVKSKRQLK